MASKLKLTELLYPTSTTAAITINSDDSVTIPTQSTTNLAYTGTLTGGTGVVNLGSGQVYKDASGNVGIGTSSPTHKLSVNKGSAGVIANITDGVAQTLQVTTGSGYVGFLNPNYGAITFRDGSNAETVRITDSGNVGIGVTPFANTLSKSLDMVSGVWLFGLGDGTYLSANAYFDSNWKYKNTATAVLYTVLGGGHAWYSAPSGTAGNVISLTQVMALDASGNLLVGTASALISSLRRGISVLAPSGTFVAATNVASLIQ